MKLQWQIILLYQLFTTCLAMSTVDPDSLSEPTRECAMKFKDNGVCACSIRGSRAPVICHKDSHRIEIQPCYCIYYDSNMNMTILGHCFFSCVQFFTTYIGIGSSTAFNNYICNKYGSFNRIGRFCSHCNDSYGLAVYSYQFVSCVPCQNYGYKNWLKYFAVALLPLTLFYILAVLMSCNVTSSSLNGIVLVIQCTTSPVLMLFYQEQNKSKIYVVLVKLVLTLLCTANLDFFRLFVYPSICLHPKANIIQVLSLDYIVALYPFLLIFITYVLVTAYDKQYRLLVWIWKPFKMCTHRCRKTWNIRTSLIEIFATFILLSSVKILGVSVQILSYTATSDVFGKKTGYYFTLYDGSIQYFGPQHFPFAMLAIAISFIFVILPLLLLAVYPCGCFHRCLNCCGLRLQTLHVFMDAFQGSYRTQPRDMRYFSAYYLLLRVLMLAQVQVFQSKLMLYMLGILSLVSAGLVTLFQPYKVNAHNKMDSILMLLMGIYFISFHEVLLLITLDYGHQWLLPSVFQQFPIWILTLVFISLIMWKLFRLTMQKMVRKIKACTWNSKVNNHGDNSNREEIESFDRDLGNSEINNYPPLLG